MRVRHEVSQELLGMALAMNDTCTPAFSRDSTPLPSGSPLAHVAEPFDGVNRSVMLTPLLAAHLQVWGVCLREAATTRLSASGRAVRPLTAFISHSLHSCTPHPSVCSARKLQRSH